VVVVNNLTTDHTLVEALSEFESVRILHAKENLGYGRAANLGVSNMADDVEWVIVVNPDVELSSNALGTMAHYGAGHPEVGIIGPRILDARGDIYPSARALPSFRNGIGHGLFSSLWPGNPWTRSYLTETAHSETPRAVGWISGSCMMIRREVFELLDGFDDRYFMYFEDVDLCRRTWAAGYSVVYLPDADAMHIGAHSTSTKDSSERMIRTHHESAATYLDASYPQWYWIPLRIIARAGLRVRAALLIGRLASRGRER
jgi:N-acetylglucosaminyl-diphospho-decaprenol L-rhamnosyltransferase